VQKQLHMVWQGSLSDEVSELAVPEGYEIRAFENGDEEGHIAVMRGAGFVGWNEKQLKNWQDMALPDGIFVAVHKETGEIVATAMASHRSTDLHPSGGELGWVAASPRHAGRCLGRTVCAAALIRAFRAGHTTMYLLTDDHRLAAVKTYLKLGFVPFLFAADMEKRWILLHESLDWPCDPASWVRAPDELWVAEHDVTEILRSTPRTGRIRLLAGK